MRVTVLPAGSAIDRAIVDYCNALQRDSGSCELVIQALRFTRAAPDRHRHDVRSPLAVGVNGARLFDAQGIDSLHDRRGDRAGGDRHGALLLFAIPPDRFRIDIGNTLVGRGADHRVDLAGAVAWLLGWRGIGAGINSGSNLALAPLPVEQASGLTKLLSAEVPPPHAHSLNGSGGRHSRMPRRRPGAISVWGALAAADVPRTSDGRTLN